MNMAERTPTYVPEPRSMPSPTVWFVVGTYAFSWTIWLLFPSHQGSFTWHIHGATITFQSFPAVGMLGILGSFGPGLCAICITGMEKGRKGIKELWAGTKRWSLRIRWYLTAVLLFPLLGLLALFLFGLIGGEIVNPGNPFRWLRLLVLNIPLGPLWEELGWRAFLLDKLQTQRSGLRASLIIGAIWGPWHLPLYWGESLEFKLWFLIMVMAGSILFTWVFNRTKRSLVGVVLLHSSWNATTIYLLAPTIYAHGILFMRLEVMMIVCMALVVLIFAEPELGRDLTPTPASRSREEPQG